MKQTTYISRLMPVLFGFFIMGFCDVVGIANSYVKKDFGLSETAAGLIPSLVFLWFLILSIPSALAMNRYGRKRMVIVSNIVTIAGMVLPFIRYNLITCMSAFLLLGIGNTILQVSLNPLLTNVVKGNALTSSLTAGQVVKAISSFCGPFIAAFAASWLGNWKYIFPIYAAITVISTLWLQFTHTDEEPGEARSSVSAALSLLGNRAICLLFFGIFFVVGADVGMNTVAPKLLIERCGMEVEQAGYASSVYFVCRTAGAFLGTILLARISDTRYFRLNMIGALIAILAMFITRDITSILLTVGLMGFFCSSVFSIIYSAALRLMPEKENEISGLMIMGIVGGAVIPPLMGVMADLLNAQTGSLIVITLCIVYLGLCSIRLTDTK